MRWTCNFLSSERECEFAPSDTWIWLTQRFHTSPHDSTKGPHAHSELFCWLALLNATLLLSSDGASRKPACLPHLRVIWFGRLNLLRQVAFLFPVLYKKDWAFESCEQSPDCNFGFSPFISFVIAVKAKRLSYWLYVNNYIRKVVPNT